MEKIDVKGSSPTDLVKLRLTGSLLKEGGLSSTFSKDTPVLGDVLSGPSSVHIIEARNKYTAVGSLLFAQTIFRGPLARVLLSSSFELHSSAA